MNNQELTVSSLPREITKKLNISWWQKVVAIVAVINFCLVIFNLTYLPLRDFYFRHTPQIIKLYDPIKGIEPHPEVTYYLETVDQFSLDLAQHNLSSEAQKTRFQELRKQSRSILAENPFLVSNDLQTWAKFKQRLQKQMDSLSTQEALTQFWSLDYFAEVGATEALNFFNQKLRPLLKTSYFRKIDDNDLYFDHFWQIDLIFVILFSLELIRKAIWRSLKQPQLSPIDILLRRWYDLLFLIPVWRWLRIIPVVAAVHKSRLVNFERILAQITHEPAAYLSDRVSNYLLVRLVNQTQDAINNGSVASAILQPDPSYVKVSSVNKLDAISDRLLELTIYNVLPRVEPDLQALLRHSLKESIKQSNFYQGLNQVPGINNIPKESIEQLADYLAASSIEIIINSYSDLEGRKLFDHLSHNFKNVLGKELQRKENQAELQQLMSELLEELKLNYVQRSSEENPEQTLDEAEEIRQVSLQSSE